MRRRHGYGWRLAAALGLLVLTAACGRGGSSEPPRTEIVPIHIDSVEVQILQSQPPQVQAVVKGVVGDSCNSLDKVVQSRSGNQISIQITAVRTLGVPCMEYAKLYSDVIKLQGDFPPGTYTVAVNGVSKSFELR